MQPPCFLFSRDDGVLRQLVDVLLQHLGDLGPGADIRQHTPRINAALHSWWTLQGAAYLQHEEAAAALGASFSASDMDTTT